LYITVLSLALEFGNALRVPEGQYREQTEKDAQQDMPSSSVGQGFGFHAQELTPEFAILPDRYRKRAIALTIWTVSDSGQIHSCQVTGYSEVGSNQWALPSAAGGRLTRHPCQDAVRQLGVAARLPLKTKQMAIPGCCGAT
jgi:hypothetical protein